MSFQKPMAVNLLKEFIAEQSGYTLGQVFYSFLRYVSKDVSGLKNATDTDILNAIEKAIEYEREN